MILNTFAGVAFGLIYWRWGLEHAIVAHCFADAVMHSMAG
jgi:hypothetical protein